VVRVRSALLAGTTAAVLALTVPMGTADAATGFFLYTAQPGNVRHLLYNPEDNVCYNISGQGRILNETNRNVELYAFSDCRGDLQESVPPEAGDQNATFVSVKFVPQNRPAAVRGGSRGPTDAARPPKGCFGSADR